MAETVFGRATRMLEHGDANFIVELLGNAARRIGILSQMPWLTSCMADKALFPTIRSKRDKFVAISKRLAEDKQQAKNEGAQDIFSCILAARDPETGTGFPPAELWAESALLIIAGEHEPCRSLCNKWEKYLY